jgi:hypothetical protein
MLQNVGGKRRCVRMDKETLTELTFLLDRVADTLGTIAPVIELAKGRNATEKKRLLRAVVDLAFRGRRALKAFSQQWALVLEENEKRLLSPYTEDFADIFQEAKQTTIPDPASSSVDEPDAARALYEVVGMDPSPNSDSVMAEETHDLQEAHQLLSPDPPAISGQVRAEAAHDIG